MGLSIGLGFFFLLFMVAVCLWFCRNRGVRLEDVLRTPRSSSSSDGRRGQLGVEMQGTPESPGQGAGGALVLARDHRGRVL